MNKELSKTKIEYENIRVDYKMKYDEVNRLQKKIIELEELREKYHLTEHQLSSQMKASRMLQEKLAALQNELLEKSIDEMPLTMRSLTFQNEVSYETIVEDLKAVIQEQFANRNGALMKEISELKAKVKFKVNL